MKGTLLKISGIYTLMCDDKMIASDDVDFQSDYQIGKLSLKNCEAIKNGYNLDELSKKETRKFLGHDVPENIMLFISHSKMFQKGFQTALELLGDKKFNQNDVLDVVNHVLHKMVLFEGFDKQYLFPESVYHEVTTKCKSLQPTEWEVEVVMDRIPADLAPGGWDVFPKLDAENCLILKRVE